MSCIYPFREFTGGGLILWELQAVVELGRGDLFLFSDHLLNHSNERVYGTRHSVVAFMEDRVWTWMQKMYEFKDYRVELDRARQAQFRKQRKENR